MVCYVVRYNYNIRVRRTRKLLRDPRTTTSVIPTYNYNIFIGFDVVGQDYNDDTINTAAYPYPYRYTGRRDVDGRPLCADDSSPPSSAPRRIPPQGVADDERVTYIKSVGPSCKSSFHRVPSDKQQHDHHAIRKYTPPHILFKHFSSTSSTSSPLYSSSPPSSS